MRNLLLKKVLNYDKVLGCLDILDGIWWVGWKFDEIKIITLNVETYNNSGDVVFRVLTQHPWFRTVFQPIFGSTPGWRNRPKDHLNVIAGGPIDFPYGNFFGNNCYN